VRFDFDFSSTKWMYWGHTSELQSWRAKRPRRKRCKSHGSIHAQYVTRNGKRYGPYWYRFHRVGGKLRKVYVPAGELDKVRAECATNQKARRQATAMRAQMKSFGAGYWRMFDSILAKYLANPSDPKLTAKERALVLSRVISGVTSGDTDTKKRLSVTQQQGPQENSTP
jgi:hypothetical protein